jgi:hypothetical protein
VDEVNKPICWGRFCHSYGLFPVAEVPDTTTYYSGVLHWPPRDRMEIIMATAVPAPVRMQCHTCGKPTDTKYCSPVCGDSATELLEFQRVIYQLAGQLSWSICD